MLIILEGCDATGKTTLAKFLAELYGAQVIHCTTDTPNTFEFFRDIIRASYNRNIIADRFCYGQFVYQEEEYRPLHEYGEPDSEYTALHNLELSMLDVDTRIIYCYADANTIQDRLISRGEISQIPVDTILNRYKDIFKQSLFTPILYKT